LVSRSVIALVRDLRLRKGRERRGLTLAEGVRLVEEALAAGVTIRQALSSPALESTPRGRRLQADLITGGHPVETIGEKEFDSLAATENPQGILAVIEPPSWSLEQVLAGEKHPALVLDGVQDPGNVGTMIRTAWGLGAAGVIALPGTAELTNPKVLRAGMGGMFRMPCLAATEAQVRQWAEQGRVRVLLAEAGAPLHRVEPGPIALVVGNEGAGISESLTRWAGGKVGIPLRAGAESLNVAIAAGILLYEVTRD
jgi:TrmH family RNA methyltransferase